MEEAAAALQAGGVAAYPVNSIPSLLSDPQEQARQQQIQTRALGITPADIYNGNPWKLSDTPPTIWRGTPGLGDHNEQVLGNLMGLSQTEIERLKQAEVIA
jgi:crotonobetainyl-CoA:carnitine CoA-transferase CaiB-like acyl-CoA transferase